MPMVSPGFVPNCWQRFSKSAHSESVMQTFRVFLGLADLGRPLLGEEKTDFRGNISRQAILTG